MLTAEWICTSCGATNRKLVGPEQTEAVDKCVTCRTRHRVTRAERPVRWEATTQQ
jgi:hypothetical protein